MKELFSMDMKNYISDYKTSFNRPSVRGINIVNNKIAVVYSKKYDLYKIPGGGINKDENDLEALKREIEEETGLIVIDETVKEWGHVLVKEKGSHEDLFIQDNRYYFFECKDILGKLNLDDYEIDEQYELRYVSAHEFLEKNINLNHNGYTDLTLIKREIETIKLLINEHYLS